MSGNTPNNNGGEPSSVGFIRRTKESIHNFLQEGREAVERGNIDRTLEMLSNIDYLTEDHVFGGRANHVTQEMYDEIFRLDNEDLQILNAAKAIKVRWGENINRRIEEQEAQRREEYARREAQRLEAQEERRRRATTALIAGEVAFAGRLAGEQRERDRRARAWIEQERRIREEVQREIREKEQREEELRERMEKFQRDVEMDGNGLWEGWTPMQLEDISNMFKEDQDINNTSLCPVCNVIAKRNDGCMFMYHDCKDTKTLYNKKLYDLYVINGLIYWCTICGRIANQHQHLQLRPIDNPPKLTDYTESTGGGSVFDRDCKWQGGGGISEKIARLQRFREFLLKSQEDVGKKTRKQVWDELIKETWNAPFTVSKNVVDKILTNKKWNFPNNAFPLETARLGPSGTTANQTAPNIPYTGDMPTNGGIGENAVTMNDNVQLFVFHHKQPDGNILHHATSKQSLINIVKSNISDGLFRCFWYGDGCKAKLYPQEIKDIIGTDNPELYERYRRLFNVTYKDGFSGGYKKMQRGGYEVLPMIVEDEFSQCILPSKNNKKIEGGRRYKRNTKKIKKSKKVRTMKRRRGRRD